MRIRLLKEIMERLNDNLTISELTKINSFIKGLIKASRGQG